MAAGLFAAALAPPPPAGDTRRPSWPGIERQRRHRRRADSARQRSPPTLIVWRRVASRQAVGRRTTVSRAPFRTDDVQRRVARLALDEVRADDQRVDGRLRAEIDLPPRIELFGRERRLPCPPARRSVLPSIARSALPPKSPPGMHARLGRRRPWRDVLAAAGDLHFRQPQRAIPARQQDADVAAQ